MILAFSTSSPWVSVALIDRKGNVPWQALEEAPRAASGACLKLLDRMRSEIGFELESVELFVADMGPGSFTGVRVGVTLAKTFGFVYQKPVAGVTSFDLVSASDTVVMPSKKGEYFIRRLGHEPVRSTELPERPFFGYGPCIDLPMFPEAGRAAALTDDLHPESAERFLPDYLIEPSISVPKASYRT